MFGRHKPDGTVNYPDNWGAIPGTEEIVTLGNNGIVEVGDRGGIEERVESPNAEDVVYKIYCGITFREATKEAIQHMEKGKDWRRKLFSIQLDMLKRIGEVFYLKRMQEINTILEKSPYNDEF